MMACKKEKQPIPTFAPVLDTVTEQPIQTEVLLPETSPDILRVVGCRQESILREQEISGTHATLEGMTEVTVFYIGEVGGLRKASYTLPFTKRLDLPQAVTEPLADVFCGQGTLRCRAVSQRRIELRGSMVQRVRIWETAPAWVLSETGDGECDLVLRTEEQPLLRWGGQVRIPFGLTERLGAPVGQPKPASILTTGCTARVTDCRTNGRRVILRGELIVSLYYKAEDSAAEPQLAKYTLPFQRSLETPLAEQGECYATCSCLHAETTLEEEVLELAVELEAALAFFAPDTARIVVDGYSTAYATKLNQTTLPLAIGSYPLAVTAETKTKGSLPADATGILWSEVTPCFYRFYSEEGKQLAAVSLRWNSLISTEERGVEMLTHTSEAMLPLEIGEQDAVLFPTLLVDQLQASREGESLAFSATITLRGLAVTERSVPLVEEITLEEKRPHPVDAEVGIRIYYAKEGENIWEIAKRYHAHPAVLQRENSLEAELLPADLPLLIP